MRLTISFTCTQDLSRTIRRGLTTLGLQPELSRTTLSRTSNKTRQKKVIFVIFNTNQPSDVEDTEANTISTETFPNDNVSSSSQDQTVMMGKQSRAMRPPGNNSWSVFSTGEVGIDWYIPHSFSGESQATAVPPLDNVRS